MLLIVVHAVVHIKRLHAIHIWTVWMRYECGLECVFGCVFSRLNNIEMHYTLDV